MREAQRIKNDGNALPLRLGSLLDLSQPSSLFIYNPL